MKNLFKLTCSEEWLEFLNFHAEQVVKKAGEHIFHIGDQVSGLYFIESGKVKISTTTPSGEDNIIRFSTDGDIVGHRGLGGDWIFPIQAQCYTQTELKFIPIKVFNVLVKGNAHVGYQLLLLMADELRKAETIPTQKTVKQRVGQVILEVANVFGMDPKDPTRLAFTIPRKDIASRAQTSYETVIRTLAELNAECIINLNKKDIHILDLTKLQQLTSGQSN